MVGGRYYSDGEEVAYSGRGAAASDSVSGIRTLKPGPDVLAVCEDSKTCPGVIAAGTRSGSRVAQNGTSVASALLAGEIVEQMRQADELNPADWTASSVREKLRSDNMGGGLSKVRESLDAKRLRVPRRRRPAPP